MSLRAVLFDWRGTLVTTLDEAAWAAEALGRLGRDDDPAPLAGALRSAADRLDGPGVDSDAALHRRTYLGVLAGLGVDPQLAEALYAVESDLSLNHFADDARPTLRALSDAGLRLAVVSDIHVDVRPAFAAGGLAGVIDVFTLSFEQGVQKPDPRMFTRTLDALGVGPAEALMVGDRSRPDGAAVECGIATLLLPPPLTAPGERRLHHVAALCLPAGWASGERSRIRARPATGHRAAGRTDRRARTRVRLQAARTAAEQDLHRDAHRGRLLVGDAHQPRRARATLETGRVRHSVARGRHLTCEIAWAP